MLAVSAEMRAPLSRPHFTPDDIIALKTKAIGLRHLSSADELSQNLQRGARDGCAFNITFKRNEYCHRQTMLDRLETEGPEHIVHEYNSAVRDAFSRSFNMDLSGFINPGHTHVEEVINKVEKSMRFVLVDYANCGTPTDADMYNGLGRYPKSYIDPDRIKATLPPFDPSRISLSPTTVLDRQLGDGLKNEIMDQFMENLTHTLRTHLPAFEDDIMLKFLSTQHGARTV